MAACDTWGSSGTGGFSMTGESVEKAVGSKPRGEEVRMRPFDGIFGSGCDSCD